MLLELDRVRRNSWDMSVADSLVLFLSFSTPPDVSVHDLNIWCGS